MVTTPKGISRFGCVTNTRRSAGVGIANCILERIIVRVYRATFPSGGLRVLQ
jgi:hypothetical protein